MIHAHLVCAAVASGGVDCAIVVDGDRAAAWQRTFSGSITIASETPFGATPEVTLDLAPPPAPDGARWTMSRAFDARDHLRCAKTTVTGTLLGADGVMWRGSLVLPRRGCAAPRVRPRVTCERVEVDRGRVTEDGTGTHVEISAFDHMAVGCRVALAPAVELRVYAQLADRSASDVEAITDGNGAIELADPERNHCSRDGVRLAITTVDGAPVWHGTAAIDCESMHGEVIDDL